MNAHTSDTSQRLHGGVVLVVDDKESARTVSALMLKRLGYRVLTAGSGADAMEVLRARASEIDVILLDVIMPDLDGWATLRQLRQVHPAVRVIMMSGADEREIKSKTPHSEEALLFLQKPFRLAALGGALA